MTLNTYLNYGGNCEQAFRFYERHLGGKVTMLMRHDEQPNLENVPKAGSMPSCMRASASVEPSCSAPTFHPIASSRCAAPTCR